MKNNKIGDKKINQKYKKYIIDVFKNTNGKYEYSILYENGLMAFELCMQTLSISPFKTKKAAIERAKEEIEKNLDKKDFI